MARVISVESVRRANAAMINGKSHHVSFDGSNVSVHCRTVVGDYTMTFSREHVVREARKACAKVVK